MSIKKNDVFAIASLSVLLGLSIYHQLWSPTLMLSGIAAAIILGRAYFYYYTPDRIIAKRKQEEDLVWEDKYPEAKIGRYSGVFLRLGAILSLCSVLLAFDVSIEMEALPEGKTNDEDGEIVPPYIIEREDPPKKIEELIKQEKVDLDEAKIEIVDNSVLIEEVKNEEEKPIEKVDLGKMPLGKYEEEIETDDGKGDIDLKDLLPPEPVSFAELFAHFPGCESFDRKSTEHHECAEQLLMNHLKAKVKYPRLAKEIQLEERVVARFVVEVDGSIGEIEIVGDPKAGTGEAVREVIENLPRFYPAEMSGIKVPMWKTVMVRFELE